ncbi:hypothetical protein X975_08713, partial [Stegodyphus mimosarum]
MFTSDSPDSSLIKFTVVSEPLPEEQDLECEDVGYGSVDLQQVILLICNCKYNCHILV